MSKPKDLFDLNGISHLVFNGDMTQCALSKKDNVVYIYKVENVNDPSTWNQTNVLEVHVQYISGLDWSAKSNRIVTCSYDKTAYVWTYDKVWTPVYVNQYLKVGYLTISWNSRGDKFAAGTGGKELLIGYFNKEADMWLEFSNKKIHKSSVVAAKIDPSSLLVISGSTDMTIYVTSCFISIDEEFLSKDKIPLCPPFGEVIYLFEPESWATSVAWSANGQLCFAASQNATIAVIDHQKKMHCVIALDHSPVSFIVPIDDTSFYAVGCDRQIYLYEYTNDTWAMKKKLTTGESSSSSSEPMKKGGGIGDFSSQGGGIRNALRIFEDKGLKKGVSIKSSKNDNLHCATISSFSVGKQTLITSDVAGFIKFWDLK